jgi:NAD(P)-dependent dehydrogenase (short-subunit alcohol dehydrogenase family)
MNSEPLFDVSNEIVIITGVSGQLGRQYAGAFLKRGSKVAGLDLEESAELNSIVKLHSSRFFFVPVDITSKLSLQSALSAVQGKFGNPTVLINNAAIDSPPSSPETENGPFESYPEESWNKVLDVNLKGVFLVCQVFGEAMAKAAVGSIINIASIYGVVSPDQSLYDYRRRKGEVFFKPVAYAASKSGIINLTRYLAVYWGKSNVRVNSLTIAGVFNNQDPEFLDAYCSRIPIGRMAQESEYNGSVLYLASKASSYMTGSNLVVDGGWTAI